MTPTSDDRSTHSPRSRTPEGPQHIEGPLLFATALLPPQLAVNGQCASQMDMDSTPCKQIH